MNKRTAEEIKEINARIDATNGRWFRVKFWKRGKPNGDEAFEIRTMTCRKGVKEYTTGVGLRYDAKSANLCPVWVANEGLEGADAYRMVNLEGVIEIQTDGKTLAFAA